MGTPTAIVCDDDPAIRALVRMILDECGFELTGEAGLAYDAADLTAIYQPTVLILDLAMPGTSGLDVIAEIREKSPSTTIIVYSAFANPPSAAIDRGASHVITKTDIEGLEATLKQLAVQAAS